VNVQIPYELDGQQEASVTVNNNGVVSAAALVQIASSAPKLSPSVFNQDGSLNSPDNPAAAGGNVTLYVTGFGVTNPPSLTGHSAVAPYPSPVAPVRVVIDGQDAEIVSAGLAPETAGVLQVNVSLPAGIGENAAVAVYVGDATSQNGVTLAVQ
jgi:uncharacterized protein (TIGR03437 family)